MNSIKSSAALIAAFLSSSLATAQVTTPPAPGPSFSIDLLRTAGPGSAPVVDPTTGGLTYVISASPDTSFGPFTGSGAGPNGAGGAIAVEFGALLPAGTQSSDIASVTVNTVDFDRNNPGNFIFGFETPSGGFNGAFPVGVQAGTVAADTAISGISHPAGDAVFFALGSRFITPADTLPLEVARIQTSRLQTGNLTHSLILTGRGAAVAGGPAGSFVAAQSSDLTTNPPQSLDFALPLLSITNTFQPGDANFSGFVTSSDLNQLANNFSNPGTYTTGDFDGSGTVDSVDLGILAGNFRLGPMRVEVDVTAWSAQSGIVALEPLTVVETQVDGGTAFTIFGDAAATPGANAFGLDVTGSTPFVNYVDGTLLAALAPSVAPGDNASFINPLLDTPEPTGLGLEVVGDDTSDADGISIGVANLGMGATLPTDEPIFLAQVVLAPGETGLVELVASNAAGEVLGTFSLEIQAVPEPTSLTLLSLGVVGALRRRR